MNRGGLQLSAQGELNHFLTIDGFKRDLLNTILDRAEAFSGATETPLLLHGKTLCNLLPDHSDASRDAFELAARQLGAAVINVAINEETNLLTTLGELEASGVELFVIRHHSSGAAHFCAAHRSPGVSVINAGDGAHAHPTQAMTDMLTIRRHKGEFTGLRVAIIGDILHSPLARSQIHGLNTLGTSEVRVIAPRTLLPSDVRTLGVHVYHNLAEGLRDVDVVIELALQQEQIQNGLLPSEHEYLQRYGLSAERLGNSEKEPLIIHSTPFNRDPGRDTSMADTPPPVDLGTAVRMAIMSMTVAARQHPGETP